MKKIFSYLFILTLIFTGCSNNVPVNYRNNLAGKTFIFSQEADIGYITLSFTEKEFSGFSGINSYSGTYTFVNNLLTLNRNFTLLNTGTPRLEAIENEYLEKLSEVESFEIKKSMLTLKLSSGETMFFFKK